MHSYLRAIGFSEINERAAIEKLSDFVINNASEKRITRLSDNAVLMEASFECADGIGITVRGEYDAEGNFHVEHYFPFCRGLNVSTNEQIFISKRVDTNSYNAMCDDYHFGVSLIFYLQNVIDYIDTKAFEDDDPRRPICLSALALDGKIMLPTFKGVDEQKTMSLKNRNRSKLIAEAKKGDQEAIENLTLEEIDLYTLISMRIKQEDVYSIVESTLIPYGAESDVYTLLGTIESLRTLKNSETGEEIYSMQLTCNDVPIALCVNKNDVYGEPAVGRRFRGTVWLQGNVDFVRIPRTK